MTGPRDLGEEDNAGTKANKSHAGEALHAKEELGWGGGAHREWCSVGERGDGKRLWVSAWCRWLDLRWLNCAREQLDLGPQRLDDSDGLVFLETLCMFITIGPMKKCVLSPEFWRNCGILGINFWRNARNPLHVPGKPSNAIFLVFGECAFLPFSVGPPGDCPWKHYGEGESGLP